MSSLGSQWRVIRHYLSLTNLNSEVEKIVQKIKPLTPEQWDSLIKKFESVMSTNLQEAESTKAKNVLKATTVETGSTETKIATKEKIEKNDEKASPGLSVGSDMKDITFDSLLQGLKLKKDLHFGKISENSWKSNKPIVTKTSIHSRTAYVISALVTAETEECLRKRTEHFVDHLQQYPEARDYAIKEGAVRALLRVQHKLRGETPLAREVTGIVNEALALVGYIGAPNGRGPRILSLDGGGIRGIIAIELLRHLEKLTGRKVDQLFDYIVGVSTGAIIAAVIGGNAGTLETANDMYLTLSKKMFGNTSLIGGTSRLVWSHAYYDTEAWEKLLKDNLGETDLTHCNRFHTPKDGGIMVNNPTGVGLHEAKLLFGAESLQNATVISIGTGKPLHKPLDYKLLPQDPPATSWKDKFNKILDSATDTEGVHLVLNDLLPSGGYFRFNPPLMNECAMDEVNDARLQDMLRDTGDYIRRNQHKFKRAADRLIQKRTIPQKIADFAKHRALLTGLTAGY